MNALQDKYRGLIDAAGSEQVGNLQVREQDGVLYIDGTAPSGLAKDNLWKKYGELDPDFAGAMW
ncbi:MAG: hypothetical protein WKF88_05410 [Ferruginibacter sp.]